MNELQPSDNVLMHLCSTDCLVRMCIHVHHWTINLYEYANRYYVCFNAKIYV